MTHQARIQDHSFKTLMELSHHKPKETTKQLNKAEDKHLKTLTRQQVLIWIS